MYIGIVTYWATNVKHIYIFKHVKNAKLFSEIEFPILFLMSYDCECETQRKLTK